jgi:hypothetical protein
VRWRCLLRWRALLVHPGGRLALKRLISFATEYVEQATRNGCILHGCLVLLQASCKNGRALAAGVSLVFMRALRLCVRGHADVRWRFACPLLVVAYDVFLRVALPRRFGRCCE